MTYNVFGVTLSLTQSIMTPRCLQSTMPECVPDEMLEQLNTITEVKRAAS